MPTPFLGKSTLNVMSGISMGLPTENPHAGQVYTNRGDVRVIAPQLGQGTIVTRSSRGVCHLIQCSRSLGVSTYTMYAVPHGVFTKCRARSIG
jgi:hypothetical protein